MNRAALLAVAAIVTLAGHSSVSSNRGVEPQFSDVKGRLVVLKVAGTELGHNAAIRHTLSSVEALVTFEPSLHGKLLDPDTATFGQYTLRVTRSRDKSHFQVSLVPSDVCDAAWFAIDDSPAYDARSSRCPH